MKEHDPDFARDVALFRYGVIAELLRLPPGSPERAEALRAQAGEEYKIPGSSRTRIAVQTLRDWLQLYAQGGFEALHPKPRADRGRTRRLAAPVAELLTDLKERHPEWAVRTLIRQAHASGRLPAGTQLAPTTVYRLLKRVGLLERAPEPAAAKDRRRFAFRDAGEFWMSDVLHGPMVGSDPADKRRRRKSYLIALLDDATRVIPHAAFAFSESAASFLPVFKQAVLRRGLPQRLYVDNGAAYRSTQLAVACASLNVHLIHARPHQPAGKGKIERFFRTVRAQFLPVLGREGTRSLAELNARWGAWLEGEYHRTPHRGLDGRTPLDQWALAAENLRRPDPALDLDRLFVFRYERRVNKDRTVRLHNVLYEVDAALVGEKVYLLQDPAVPPERPLHVLHQGRDAGRATLLDAYANTRVKRASARSRSAADTVTETASATETAPAEPAAAPLRLSDLADREDD